MVDFGLISGTIYHQEWSLRMADCGPPKNIQGTSGGGSQMEVDVLYAGDPSLIPSTSGFHKYWPMSSIQGESGMQLISI